MPENLMRPLRSDSLKPRASTQAVWEPSVSLDPVMPVPEPVTEPNQPVEPSDDFELDSYLSSVLNEQEAPQPESIPYQQTDDYDLDAVIASILDNDDEDDEEDFLPLTMAEIPSPVFVPLYEEPAPKRKKRRWPWVLLILLLLIVAAVGAAYHHQLVDFPALMDEVEQRIEQSQLSALVDKVKERIAQIELPAMLKPAEPTVRPVQTAQPIPTMAPDPTVLPTLAPQPTKTAQPVPTDQPPPGINGLLFCIAG